MKQVVNSEGLRVVQMGDMVEIFKDPDTEKDVEGHAFVREILEDDGEFYLLIVTFLGDPRERRVPRKYRKKAAE